MKKDFSAVHTLGGLLLCSFLLIFSGFAAKQSSKTLKYISHEYSPYAETLSTIMPDFEMEHIADGALLDMKSTTVVEAFDVQAIPYLEAVEGKHWYPQYMATVVIAVDRDMTDAEIAGWRDLGNIEEEIGLMNYSVQVNFSGQISAISYGLEGEGYTLKSASELLQKIHEEGRFNMDSSKPPVLICFDYQAVNMAQCGRNVEIIVPAEGTLTYVSGLLSNEELDFGEDIDRLLLDAGLRLTDGRSKSGLYPAMEEYGAAKQVSDIGHWCTVSLDISKTIRREVERIRLYTSADAREHQFMALAYIGVMLFWVASVMRRALQSGVKQAALLTGFIMLCWITVRLIKYQTLSGSVFNRYLWYSFYIFQLTLPLVLLWLGWVIDKPAEKQKMPRWLGILSALNGLLIMLTLTNDFHGFVFRLDLSNPLWNKEYEYGLGFVLVTVAWVTQLVAGFVLMMVKSARNPNKKGRIFPLLFCILLILYGLGYILRVPIAWHSDMTMMVGIFALLFFESSIRSGMIPVNTKYISVFSNSTLSMQLLNESGVPTLKSASAMPLGEKALNHILSGNIKPQLQDENTLIFSKAISGGFAVWEEDISGINQLYAETKQSVGRLKAATALLSEEEKIKRQLGEEAAKKQLMEQLESEINQKLNKLSRMTSLLDENAENQPETAQIAMLLCFIKRRCNLFFKERESDFLPADELSVYLDELAELASHAGVKTASISTLKGDLPVRRAILFYDFFYEITAWAAENHCCHIVGFLGEENGAVTMRLLPSEDISGINLNEQLVAAVEESGGKVSIKDLDDAVGITLSFAERGYVDERIY